MRAQSIPFQTYKSKASDTTFSIIPSVIIINPMSMFWNVSHTDIGDEDILSHEDERLVAAGFNAVLDEFNNPDTHKSYNTVEELFADLDKKEK